MGQPLCTPAPGEQAPAPSCYHQIHLGVHEAPLATQALDRGGPCVPKGTGLGASLLAPPGDKLPLSASLRRRDHIPDPQVLPLVLFSCGSTWDKPLS